MPDLEEYEGTYDKKRDEFTFKRKNAKNAAGWGSIIGFLFIVGLVIKVCDPEEKKPGPEAANAAAVPGGGEIIDAKVVVDWGLPIRERPEPGAPQLTSKSLLVKADSFSVMEVRGDWIQIKTPSGVVGWVRTKLPDQVLISVTRRAMVEQQ